MSDKAQNFVSAVVYVHNNETQLAGYLEKIGRMLAEQFEHYEIICVNDWSTDGSVEAIQRFAKGVEHASVTILHMSYYQGVELSMNAGVDLAIGDFVYEFDKMEDFPEELVRMVYRTALEGYDIVSAAPDRADRLTSRLFYRVYNKAAGGRHAMLRQETFRVLSRRAINRVQSMAHSVPYRKALYANCGLRTKAIPYEVGAKTLRLSREEKEMRMDTAVNSLILFTDVGYRAASALAALMMLLTVLIGLYTVVIFVGARPVEGWTTTMLFLTMGFFGVFALFALVMKYLTVVLDLIFTKQRYAIEQVEKVK